MIRLVLIVVLLSAMSGAQSKSSQPTLEHCKEVAVSWRTATERYRVAREFSVGMVNSRDKEILSCELQYPDAGEQAAWEKIGCDLHRVLESRFTDFLDRHQLWNQFLSEDEEQANKRSAEDKTAH